MSLTLIPLGGGTLCPPLDIFRDKSETRKARAMILCDFFVLSLAQLLRPNLRWPGVWLRRYARLKKICQAKNGSKTWFHVQSQCKLCIQSKFINLCLFFLSLAETVKKSAFYDSNNITNNFYRKNNRNNKVEKTKKYIRN